MSQSGEVEETFRTVHEFLTRLSCALDADAMDDLIETDLGFTHYKALLILNRHGNALSVNELADELHLSLAAAGRAVDKLVGLSMVSRREDEHDRRIKRISLAEGGEKAVALSIRRREDSVRDVIAKLPSHMRADLNSALLPILAGDYLSTPMCSDNVRTGSATQGLAATTSAAAR
ncbi:MarR family winged helix-turn-helix transcriptional regulator [Williamsia muralis]|uniref:MarR family winged helix-turn-helix transcriptional regulator n=1 Tax=Williamsia marianensis TaxID=85044 RepID=UPI003F5CE009